MNGSLNVKDKITGIINSDNERTENDKNKSNQHDNSPTSTGTGGGNNLIEESSSRRHVSNVINFINTNMLHDTKKLPEKDNSKDLNKLELRQTCDKIQFDLINITKNKNCGLIKNSKLNRSDPCLLHNDQNECDLLSPLFVRPKRPYRIPAAPLPRRRSTVW